MSSLERTRRVSSRDLLKDVPACLSSILARLLRLTSMILESMWPRRTYHPRHSSIWNPTRPRDELVFPPVEWERGVLRSLGKAVQLSVLMGPPLCL